MIRDIDIMIVDCHNDNDNGGDDGSGDDDYGDDDCACDDGGLVHRWTERGEGEEGTQVKKICYNITK